MKEHKTENKTHLMNIHKAETETVEGDDESREDSHIHIVSA